IVLKSKLDIGAKTSGLTPTSSQMTAIVEDCLIEFQRALIDAPIQMIKGFITMVAGVLKFSLSGWKIDENFSDILLPSRDGTIQNLNWTALKMIKGTSREICNSAPAGQTIKTVAQYNNYRNGFLNWRHVYDLANAGPLKRFTILSDKGPLIVHNCELAFGFQGGVEAYKRFMPADSSFTDEEINKFKLVWRKDHPHIERFWYGLNNACYHAVRNPGTVYQVGQKNIFVESDTCPFMYVTLPSGRQIAYPEAKIIQGSEHPYLTFMDNTAGQWVPVRGYGGLFTENLVQGIARDLLAGAMLR